MSYSQSLSTFLERQSGYTLDTPSSPYQGILIGDVPVVCWSKCKVISDTYFLPALGASIFDFNPVIIDTCLVSIGPKTLVGGIHTLSCLPGVAPCAIYSLLELKVW